jgi:hypothetical protein
MPHLNNLDLDLLMEIKTKMSEYIQEEKKDDTNYDRWRFLCGRNSKRIN